MIKRIKEYLATNKAQKLTIVKLQTQVEEMRGALLKQIDMPKVEDRKGLEESNATLRDCRYLISQITWDKEHRDKADVMQFLIDCIAEITRLEKLLKLAQPDQNRLSSIL